MDEHAEAVGVAPAVAEDGVTAGQRAEIVAQPPSKAWTKPLEVDCWRAPAEVMSEANLWQWVEFAAGFGGQIIVTPEGARCLLGFNHIRPGEWVVDGERGRYVCDEQDFRESFQIVAQP